MQDKDLKAFLDEKVHQYNRPGFIEDDPVVIPHLFSRKQDIEIMGFWAAMLAWGQRKTIIAKCRELAGLMDGAPYDFILNHRETDLRRFLHFKHRTFNATDTLYFITFFRYHYMHYDSLEDAFIRSHELNGEDKGPAGTRQPVETYLNRFKSRFFSLPDHPLRTRKHISSPGQGSTCKRLNMFLRWMVRKDGKGVDFGLWKRISPAQLICPCDVHVDRVARKLGLITRKQTDWKTTLELTRSLRLLDPADPVKYDFALFGLGVGQEL